MRKNERVFLGVTAVIMVAICAFLALRMFYHSDDDLSGPLLPKPEETQQETPKEVEKPVEKVYVNVYFIGQNGNEEVYKAVNREYDKAVDGSKIKFAVSIQSRRNTRIFFRKHSHH